MNPLSGLTLPSSEVGSSSFFLDFFVGLSDSGTDGLTARLLASSSPTFCWSLLIWDPKIFSVTSGTWLISSDFSRTAMKNDPVFCKCE